jgi:hypothetical protein
VLTECPACKAATFAKQVTAAGFQLKGSGWYVTDFRDGNKPPPAKGEATGKPADETRRLHQPRVAQPRRPQARRIACFCPDSPSSSPGRGAQRLPRHRRRPRVADARENAAPVKKYLVAGLLVWLPLAITIWVLSWLLGAMDGMFASMLSATQACCPNRRVPRWSNCATCPAWVCW